MKFLLDESVSPLAKHDLASAGHDVLHVRDIGLTSAADPIVLDAAIGDARVLVTLDTDFGALGAHGRFGANRRFHRLLVAKGGARLRRP